MSIDPNQRPQITLPVGSPQPTGWILALSAIGGAIGFSLLLWVSADQGRPITSEPGSKPGSQATAATSGQFGGNTGVGEPAKPKVNAGPRAIRANELFAAERRSDRLREQLDELTLVAKRIELLHTNADGKRIAADPESYELFLTLKALLEPHDLDLWNTKHGELQSIVERGRNLGPDERLPEESKWKELEDKVSAVIGQFRDVGRVLDGLLAKAPESPSGSPTLKEALEKREEQRVADLARRLAEARQETKAEIEAEIKSIENQILEAKNEMKRIEAQAAAAAEGDRVTRVEMERKHEAEVRRKEAEHQALVKKFELEYPRFKDYLIPFTSHGYTQPHDREFVQTGTKGPVSFAKLVGTGALEEGRAERLGTVARKFNDRNLGAFPDYTSSGEQYRRNVPTFIAVHAFLRIYGPIMVEKGLLAP